MLRYLIGDDIFFEILNEFLHIKKELPNNQVSSNDFIEFVHKKYGKNIDWFLKYICLKKNTLF